MCVVCCGGSHAALLSKDLNPPRLKKKNCNKPNFLALLKQSQSVCQVFSQKFFGKHLAGAKQCILCLNFITYNFLFIPFYK